MSLTLVHQQLYVESADAWAVVLLVTPVLIGMVAEPCDGNIWVSGNVNIYSLGAAAGCCDCCWLICVKYEVALEVQLNAVVGLSSLPFSVSH